MPSKSYWAALLILVPNKDSTIRLCVYCQYQNRVIKLGLYSMPWIEDCIDGLASNKYISTMDLTKCYWQVPVDEASVQKTTFTTQFSKYEFRVMPFGLVGDPAMFQILADLSNFSAVYMDDQLIFSSIWENHLSHLS